MSGLNETYGNVWNTNNESLFNDTSSWWEKPSETILQMTFCGNSIIIIWMFVVYKAECENLI